MEGSQSRNLETRSIGATAEALPRPPQRRGARWLSRRAWLAASLLLLAAWLLPPVVSAERYRLRLESGLERALKRPATFGAISYRLLPSPGFEIENVVVREDPAFGLEPLAYVDRIDCDLRWRSLLGSRIELSRLYLESPTVNIVRNASGQWNVENLLLTSRIASPSVPSAGSRPPARLDLEVEAARLNFKLGDSKKAFAITGLAGRLNFDPERGLLNFRLAGLPVRTDLMLPGPGEIELEGNWAPGGSLDGAIQATVRTHNSLLYDWVPLVTGRNPEIYGVIDLTAQLTGSVRRLGVEGQGELSDFHRWGQAPPSDSRRVRFEFRGGLDRTAGRMTLEGVDVAFGDSRLHVAGSIQGLATTRDIDAAVTISGGQAADLLAVGRRFWVIPDRVSASGRLDGVVAMQGPWADRRLGGLLTARQVRVSTPAGVASVSDATLRIDAGGVRLAPVRITLAPHLEVVAEGVAGDAASAENAGGPQPARGAGGRRQARLQPGLDTGARGPWPYRVTLSARFLPLGDLLRFARAAGLRAMPGVEAKGGSASADFRLDGAVRTWRTPSIDGRVEVEAARFVLPGLSEPLAMPHALVRVTGDRVIATPLEISLGANTFSGRVEHEGDGRVPWRFDLATGELSLDEGALWFEALGHRTAPRSILDLLPGLSSYDRRRAAAATLFGALNAQGVLRASRVSSRSINLAGPVVPLQVSGRVVRITDATFRAAGGRGRASVAIDLAAQPARLSGELALEDAGLQPLEPWLPASLERLRGSVSGSGKFVTSGLTRQEMSAHLEGEAALRLKELSFGDFDPLAALAEQCHWGALDPARRRVTVRSAQATVRVHDRRALLKTGLIEMEGARLGVAGNYSFDGKLDVAIHADFTHLARRWQTPATYAVASPPSGLAGHAMATPAGAGGDAADLLGNVHLIGPLDRLEVAPAPGEPRLDPPAR